MSLVRLSTVAAVVALSSCQPAERNVSSVVRDSAGIAIVEASREAVLKVPAWDVSAQPTLSIGIAEGGSMYEFYRLADAATLPTGNIAVLVDREIRVFDSSGRFLRQFARAGEGPGELDQPTSIRVVGDSVVVFDESLQRISVFSEQGDFHRSTQLTPASRNPALGAVLQDGALLIFDVHYRRPARRFETLMMNVTRHAADGSLQDSLPKLPFAEMTNIAVTDVITTRVFGATTAAAGYAGGYWVAEGPPVVSRYGPDGKIQVISRWDAGELRIESADVQEHIDAAVSRSQPQFREIGRRELEATPVAERYPATLRAIASNNGELWVERYEPYTSTDPSEWFVFGVDGALRGRVTLPNGFVPVEVGVSHVLGHVRAENDVERLAKYNFRRVPE